MIRYSYENFYTDIRQIATWVETWDEVSTPSLQWDPNLIISIARGGLVPGVYLSHMIGVRNKPVIWQTRDGKINETINIDSSEILIVDDINDTGDTLAWIKQDWDNSGKVFTDGKSEINWEANVRFAVLTENEPSKFGDVDYVSKFINKNEDPQWIVYPWEEWWAI